MIPDEALHLRLKLRHRFVQQSVVQGKFTVDIGEWRGKRHEVLQAVDKFTTGRCCVLTKYVMFEDEQDAIMFKLGYNESA